MKASVQEKAQFSRPRRRPGPDPLFTTRSRLAASVPAAHAHGRYLDADYENVFTEALAASRKTNPATDL
jgi:hypothetical protein